MANGNNVQKHYYGDIVRKLFLLGGAIMLVILPFVYSRLPVPYITSILIIMAIDVFAGITNPAWEWIELVDSAVSLVGFIIFSFYTVQIYIQNNVYDILFWGDFALGVIFFFALYFSTKTLRGKLAS